MKTTTKTATATFTAPKAHIKADWPDLKRWPDSLGAQPSEAAVKLAKRFNKAGSAVTMAWAMYARPNGATDLEAATAATVATGSKSASHRVKRDMATAAGNINTAELGKRGNRTVYRIALPAKANAKPRAARKAKPAAKPAADTAEANAN